MKSIPSKSTIGLVTCIALLSAATAAPALTPAEATGVLYLKQEEKLARDVYQVFAARWDQAVFRNLALAEQKHLDAVNGLIASYALDDPAPAESGRFSIPELQALYDQLLTRGQASVAEALKVGLVIEETDIADLKETAAVSVEAPIRRVLANLLRASERHQTVLSAAAETVANGGTLPAGTGACLRSMDGSGSPACTGCPGGQGTCTGEGRGAKAGGAMGCGSACRATSPTTTSTPPPVVTPRPGQRRSGR